jgi:hypothetical protein
MTILVTGSAGHLGEALMRSLRAEGVAARGQIVPRRSSLPGSRLDTARRQTWKAHGNRSDYQRSASVADPPFLIPGSRPICSVRKSTSSRTLAMPERSGTISILSGTGGGA